LYKGYDEQGYEYTVLMKPASDELKEGVKSLVEQSGSGKEFEACKERFAELFKGAYKEAQERVEEAKESICESISKLDHPRAELVTRFECDITFYLDVGVPLPLGDALSVIVNDLAVETVIDRVNTGEYGGDACPMDEDEDESQGVNELGSESEWGSDSDESAIQLGFY